MIRVSYRGGDGGGGFIPLMILAGGGGYPPHQTAEQCFFMGILVKPSRKCSEDKSPFLANLCFLIVPPINFFLAETLMITSMKSPHESVPFKHNVVRI